MKNMEPGTRNMEEGTWKQNMEHRTWNMEGGTWNIPEHRIIIIIIRKYVKLSSQK